MRTKNRSQRTLSWPVRKMSRVIVALAFSFVASARSVGAQCMEWSPVFDPLHALSNRVYALHVHDDGGGLALYAGGKFGSKVRRYRDGAWSQVGFGTGPNDDVICLQSFDPGSGTKLYIGGLFTQVGQFPNLIPASGVAQWDGTVWSPLTPPYAGPDFTGVVTTMEVFDDGGGPALYIGGESGGAPQINNIVKWSGSSYSWLGTGVNSAVKALKSWDDGTGPALYVGGYFTQAGGQPADRIAKWTGSAWVTLGSGTSSGVEDLEVFDDGGGPALYAALSLPPGVVRWDGAAWVAVGGGVQGADALEVYDDGTGPELYVGGGFGAAGGVPAHGIAKWNGYRWAALGAGVDSPTGQSWAVRDLAVFDDGYGGGPDLMLGGDMRYAGNGIPSNWIAAWRGCGTGIEPVCSGDGSLRACPCGNSGAPGFGCAWSGSAQGAWLVSNGTTMPDTLVLSAFSMPTTAPGTIFLKADQFATDGILFGDGLRCIDGQLVRLGTKQNSGGSAQYPDVGDALLSVRGGTPPGSGMVAYYQTYFRNAAAFCTTATFNITNGLRVVW